MPAEPFYRQIIADIRARIALGAAGDQEGWPPGKQLPTTRELAAYYAEKLNNPDLSAGTVRQAVTILIEAGELRGQQGKAVYVAER